MLLLRLGVGAWAELIIFYLLQIKKTDAISPNKSYLGITSITLLHIHNFERSFAGLRKLKEHNYHQACVKAQFELQLQISELGAEAWTLSGQRSN